MTLRSLTVAVIAAAAMNCGQQSQKTGAALDEALQAALDESIETSGAIGVSAAVIFSDGHLWKGAAGMSHEGVPVSTEMLFDIGSVEKNFQAALTLKLAEEGLFSLDDPLEKWFPPYPNISGKITIRQVLNLTSGIDNIIEDSNSPFRVGYTNIDHEKTWAWEEIYTTYVGKPNFEPGTRCAYSSTNYIVLRHVIEKATRKKQEAVLEDLLLAPLGLTHTLTDVSESYPDTMPIAHGWFDTDGDGTPDDISGYSITWIASLSPLYVYSTPTDLVRWIDAIYHRKTVLKEETLNAMLRFIGPVQNEPLMRGYGLGTVDMNLGPILPKWKDVQAYGHAGSMFGYSCLALYIPEIGISVSMMFNRGADAGTNKAIGVVVAAFFDVLFESQGLEGSDEENALADMLRKLEKSPNDVHLMYEIARRYQADKEDYEASLLFEEILKQDPEDNFGYRTEALYWKASYDGVIWKKPENLIAFIAGHKDYKDIKDAHRWLAKTYQRRNEMDKAIQVYHDALRIFEKDAEFYNHFGWWVYENKVAGEYQAAIKYTEEALVLKPDAHYIWDTLAWLLLENGEQQRAVEASAKALSLAPKDQQDAYRGALERIKESVR